MNGVDSYKVVYHGPLSTAVLQQELPGRETFEKEQHKRGKIVRPLVINVNRYDEYQQDAQSPTVDKWLERVQRHI